MNIKKRIIAAIFLLTMLLATPMSSKEVIAAQDDSPVDIVHNLPGIQSAIARRYLSIGHFGWLEATPNVATPAAADAVSRIDVTVLEFESSIIVTTAFGTILNDDLALRIIGGDATTLESHDIPNLGDRARLYLTDSDAGDVPASGLLVVQDGNLGFLISGNGDDTQLIATLRAFADYMLAAEPGGEIVYGNAADSTGGTFDLLPSGKDGPFLGYLIPMYDYDLLNVGNSPIEMPATPPAG